MSAQARGPRPAPEGVRALDHTADVGLEVRAPDLPALFTRAALGLEWLLGNRAEAKAPAPASGGPADAPPTAPAAAPVEGAPTARAPEAVPPPAGTASTEVDITLYAPELPVLLADWLRELLYLRQVRGRRFESAGFQELSATALLARVRFTRAAGEPVREIKGVTYHGLEAGRAPGGGWRARLIMDV